MIYELEGVGLALAGRQVLRQLSLRISPGERVVVLGVNGCGKTTFLKVLAGLLFPDAGSIHYRGASLGARELEETAFRRRFRSEVGFLFQNVDAMLFNPSVSDEIAFGPRQLGVAGAEERAARWAGELGVEGFMDRPPFELSGGEKKRVALAALLALEPEVLLLDEATAGLDPASAARLIDLLASRPGMTVVSSTHNLTVAEELGSRAVLLAPGRAGALFDGPTAELLGSEQLLAESGLAHRHGHRHRGVDHAHYHVHDAD